MLDTDASPVHDGLGVYGLAKNGLRSRLGGWFFILYEVGRANGLEVHPRGQGPRGYGSASRRLPAFEGRGAGGVTPLRYR